MAINGWELQTLQWLLGERRKRSGKARLQVLSLGYPDLLITRREMTELIGADAVGRLSVREESAELARDHSFPELAEGVFEAHDVFAGFGATLTVSDVSTLRHADVIIDLNDPVSDDLHDRFDLIIDPGTIEHCFNVAQAMKNISEMTAVGGFVFHSTPGAYMNHGFYSFSPTFFLDYYSKNGFLVLRLQTNHHDANPEGETPLARMNFVDLMHYDIMMELPRYPLIIRAIAMKQTTTGIAWPIQRIYGGP